MAYPLISVIMPVYNSYDYIRQSVMSILRQTYRVFEFIIIDDASTDGTSEIIESIARIDKRIIFIKNKQNQGLTVNLNRAAAIAKGSYIARMDADDISLPQRFEKQLSFMEKNLETDICGTWADVINSQNKVLFRAVRPVTDEKIKAKLICGNPILHPSVMMRKKLFLTEKYDESFVTMQDFKLWTDCWDKTFHNIPEILLLYRDNKKGVSQSDKKNRRKRLENTCRIYHALFERLNIKLSDKEVFLYVKTVHVLEKFASEAEAEEALKICEKVHTAYPEMDINYAYSRWAMQCGITMAIQNPGYYILGKIYRGHELFEMIPGTIRVKR